MYSMSYVPPFAGILINYIRERQKLVENEGVILNFAIQICAAMKFLEAKGIIHKDLVIKLLWKYR